jgi:membrane protease subunit (stomatin/prohibitin family)
MALIDVVKWDAAGDELMWKFPNSELSTMTQLIVHESQWAMLYKDGQRLDTFGAGRHTLSTNNLPLLNKLVNLPFGGQSPFKAEVWFVNKAIPLDLKWGTPTPLQLEDPQYGLVVPVSAFGQMGVRIADAGQFAGSLMGTLRSFRTGDFLNHFKGVLVSQLKASIASAIIKRQIPVLQIETELVTLSEAIQQEIAPHYARFGLEVQLFRIMSISMPQDDPGVLELKKAKAAAARRKIEGTNYQQERTFDVMQSAAGNQGMGGAFASMGMGLAAGQMVGQVAAQQVPGVMGVPPPPAQGFGAPRGVGAPPPNFQYLRPDREVVSWCRGVSPNHFEGSF